MVNNINKLNKVLSPYIENAMKMTRDIVFEIVSQKVVDYYNEPVFSEPDESEPDYYRRTGKLMESLSASAITTMEANLHLRLDLMMNIYNIDIPLDLSQNITGNRIITLQGTMF